MGPIKGISARVTHGAPLSGFLLALMRALTEVALWEKVYYRDPNPMRMKHLVLPKLGIKTETWILKPSTVSTMSLDVLGQANKALTRWVKQGSVFTLIRVARALGN